MAAKAEVLESGRATRPAEQQRATPVSTELSVAQLTKRYAPGSAPVLDAVSLSVGRGERVALLGANGSGKSTLLRCCLRLIEPSQGHIRLFNDDVLDLSRAQLRRLRTRTGFVFQRHNLVGRLSVLSNVLHGALGRARHPGDWFQATTTQTARAQALACLREVGLAGCAAQRADRLSGGQSQRVAIARTLMQQPRLVFADEPAASLDPAAGEEVMGLFSRLIAEQGMSLVFSSHDLDHARRYADRIIALRGGQVVFDEPASRVDFGGLYELYQKEAG
jgi:phosphonate transport system ATP-binding protein